MSRNILIKPIISEKSEKLTAKGNQYTFVVDKKANKLEIKKAVEAMFTTNVVAVNTVIVPAKIKIKKYTIRCFERKHKFLQESLCKTRRR
jgi:ribosomal protein L23